MAKRKITVNVSFDYECEVNPGDKEAELKEASDKAMDYLEGTLSDSRAFDEFWEYKATVTLPDMCAKLSKEQAYQTMYSFLESYYQLTGSDEIGGLRGSMSLLVDGATADPAIFK
jgi:hypothetical protein